MKDLIKEMVSVVPKLVERSQFNFSLAGTPATVAIGIVCLSGVAIFGIHSRERLEEKKMKILHGIDREPDDVYISYKN